MLNQNLINHIAIVVDRSDSMGGLTAQTEAVVDNQIAHLAQLSKTMDQETRVTVYTFSDTVECVIYDKDVLRMPSLKGQFRPRGMTALIDATVKSIDDLAQTAELYGDHSFLIYVITDGGENASRKTNATQLDAKLKALKDNWTVATFVPNLQGKLSAERLGFPKGNIEVWDTTAKGIKEVGEKIRATTTAYMTARSTGVRGSKNLFNLDDKVAKLSKTDLRAKATKLAYQQYRVLEVKDACRIDELVESKLKRPYRVGEAYYQLSKTEKVQSDKGVAIRDKKTKELFVGDGARDLIGLPPHEVKVGVAFSPEFDIFIQSSSVNRKCVPGTQVLIIS